MLMLTNVEILMPLDGEDKLRITASNLNFVIITSEMILITILTRLNTNAASPPYKQSIIYNEIKNKIALKTRNGFHKVKPQIKLN